MKPFIIYTYDYSIGSGGIKVMHKLCDLLNKNGFESYLTPVGFDKGYYKISSDDIITHLNKIGEHHVSIKTIGGALAVSFNNKGGGHFNNIWLQGPGTFVYSASINLK
jgi:hypothetical protein